MFKKFIMGEYRWISYEDANTSADYFGRGLRALGMNQYDKICVFAETRAGKGSFTPATGGHKNANVYVGFLGGAAARQQVGLFLFVVVSPKARTAPRHSA
jgi:hypothetical protein